MPWASTARENGPCSPLPLPRLPAIPQAGLDGTLIAIPAPGVPRARGDVFLVEQVLHVQRHLHALQRRRDATQVVVQHQVEQCDGRHLHGVGVVHVRRPDVAHAAAHAHAC
ncbi:hypothetical protein G6F52_013951 [Rhizopus delemar]|nr:hypothetical protein G6F52_013951 [Rhizopus delemar]